MNATSAILVGALLFAVPAARSNLGESEADLASQYGDATEIEPSLKGSRLLCFEKDGAEIFAELIGGKVAQATYVAAGPWSADAVKVILDKNAEGSAWAITKESVAVTRAARADGKATAFVSGRNLVVTSREYMEAKNKAAAAAADKL